MANVTAVRVMVPSWDNDENACEPYTVTVIGAALVFEDGTRIKKNDFPTSDSDCDVMCDSYGNLSGESPLTNATRVYIWGFGFTMDGEFCECEPDYHKATEIDITEDTEIVLWGANSDFG